MQKRLEKLGYKILHRESGVVFLNKGNSGNAVLADGTIRTMSTLDVQRLKNGEELNMNRYYTEKQLQDKSSKELVKIYNTNNPDKPVKKFADKKKAVKRVFDTQPEPKNTDATKKSKFPLTMKIYKTGNGKFNQGSLRESCHNIIKDGMTLKQYLEAAAKASPSITEGKAKACLQKMLAHPTTPSVRVEE
jgi:hypothetical protein